MTTPILIAWYGPIAISMLAIGGAIYLLIRGYEYGWGWLLLIGFLALPSFRHECREEDSHAPAQVGEVRMHGDAQRLRPKGEHAIPEGDAP